METGRIALIFFYGIFWASALNAASRYRPFETNELFSKNRKEKKIILRRILISLLFLNLFPIGWLWLLYMCVVPDNKGIFPVLMAAFASLSVFGFHRILHAIIATTKSWHKYYASKEEHNEVIQKWKGKPIKKDTFKAHFIPGLVYLLGFTLIAKIMSYL